MNQATLTGAPLHPAINIYLKDEKAGKLSRREFIARSTALGVTTAGAYGLLGLQQPAAAAGAIKQGGTLRVQMIVYAMKDPRTFDWSELSHISSGWLEYLVEYNNDGSFTPMLLKGWEISDDAKTYTLNVREGVKWNNGDDFTAMDVARNIAGWCESDVEGNSMAGRFAALIDRDTGKAIDGAIEVLDATTVQLNLPASDISLIAGMSDYPAAITHADNNVEDMMTTPIGTGPYLPEQIDAGIKAVLVRNDEHEWWGYAAEKGAYLDRIEFIDLGTDPSSHAAAVVSDEIDIIYETTGDFVDIFDSLGWDRSEVASGATLAVRPNQQAEVDGIRPYEDVRVRRAIQMAVDNNVLLELGYADRGQVARNQHVGPMHPEWADIPGPQFDPDGALALLAEAGMHDYEFELISVDDEWLRNTTDAVAAQLNDAGFNVKRRIIPGGTYWKDWQFYPFSSTNWNHRPLGIQILALAYRSGAAWNESGYANPEFDALLDQANGIADADARSVVMAKLQQMMLDDAVTIQPYWRSIYRHARPGLLGWEAHIAYLPRYYKIGFAA